MLDLPILSWPSIVVCTHVYNAMRTPDNWNNVNLGWGKSWLQVHAFHAKALGKPLVIEEWGKYVGVPRWPQHAPPVQSSLPFAAAWGHQDAVLHPKSSWQAIWRTGV